MSQSVVNPSATATDGLARRSEKRLKVYAPRTSTIVWRLVIVTSIVLVAAAAVYPSIPRVYTATGDILIRPTDQQGAPVWDQSQREALDDNAITTKVDILRSLPLARQVINEHHLLDDPEFNAAVRPSRLRDAMREAMAVLRGYRPVKANDHADVEASVVRHLVVRRERKSYILQVGFQSADPEKAARMTNTLIRAFLVEQVNRKQQSHAGLMKTFEERAKTLEFRYHAHEAAEFQFTLASGLMHQGLYDSTRKQIDSLSAALGSAHEKTIALSKRAAMLSKLSGDNLLSESLASPLLQALQRRYIELRSGSGSTGVPMGANGTVIEELKRDINAESLRLVKVAQNDAAIAAQTEAEIQAEIARLDGVIVKWLIDSHKRDEMHRQVLLDVEAMNAANQQALQEAGRGDILQPDVEIISPAEIPDRPSFPQLIQFAAGTVALVILLNGLLLLPTLTRKMRASRG